METSQTSNNKIKAPKPKIRDFLREHGIRQAWVARKIGMSTSLIRHYLDKEVTDPDVEEQIRKLLNEHARIILKQTGGTRRRFQ